MVFHRCCLIFSTSLSFSFLVLFSGIITAALLATGMGTKVQCKSYLPGYHPTRDVNEDENFNWSPFCEEKTFSRNLYKSFKPQGFRSWPEYDKETLKRTMLQHEAMFRNQVNELHRLYRIQKDLMHELERKQLGRLYGPTETSKSSVYRSQINPEFDEKIWQPPLPSTHRSTAVGIDGRDKRPTLSAAQTQFMNGGFAQNDKLEDIKIKQPRKRTLDLHLPADVYIEEEDSEKIQGENAASALNAIHDMEAENDVELTLGSAEVAGFAKSTANSDLYSGNSRPAHWLADLNMPIEVSFENGHGDSCTHKCSGLYELPEGYQQPRTPIRSNTSSRQANIFEEKVELRQEWRLLHNCPDQSKVAVDSFSPALFIGKYPMSTEAVKLKFENAQDSHLPDQSQTKAWFQEKATHSKAMSVPPPFSYTVCSSASWTKPAKIVDDINPVAVRALPCFGTSFMPNGQSKNYSVFKQRNGVDDDNLQCNGYKRLQTRFDEKPPSGANGHHHHHHGIQVNSLHGRSEIHEPNKCSKGLDFVDVKSAKELSLSHGTNEKSSNGLALFRESSSCNVYGNNNQCSSSRVDSRSSKDYSRQFTELYGSSICSSKIQQGSGGTFSITGNCQRNFNCSNYVSFDEESSADHAMGFMKGKTFRNCISSLRKDISINLNSELTPTIDNKPVGVPSRVAKKRKHKIDLEAPADELEDGTFSDTEAVDINRPRITIIGTSQEKMESSEEGIHLRSAAAAIVSISMDAHSRPSLPSSADSLHLLAEVITQDAESCGVSEDDGSDNFESMTIKLEEIKHGEHCCFSFRQHQQEKPKDEMIKSVASMLLPRSRRGQARKRRQKRDFQRDVLPALASLSRYEVAEDLHALGGITRACKSRQINNSTRTSARQNKSSTQARGKRRPRSPAAGAGNAENCNGPPRKQQPTHIELENNGMSMMSWGRTTRRCPRQRVLFTTSNASSAVQSI